MLPICKRFLTDNMEYWLPYFPTLAEVIRRKVEELSDVRCPAGQFIYTIVLKYQYFDPDPVLLHPALMLHVAHPTSGCCAPT
jgi:hypothetical protein